MQFNRRAFFDPLVAFYGALTLICVTALAIVGMLSGHSAETLAAGAIITSAGFGLIAHRYARLTPPPLRPGEARITSEVSGDIGDRNLVLEAISASRDHRPRIMLIDDDRDSRETMGMVLRGLGFKIIEAEDGQEALQMLQTEIPDLILLDLMMPRLNGWEFRAMQLEDPRLREIPVIILSGAGYGAAEQAASMGVDFLDKPIDLAALEALIQDRLPIK